MKTLANLPAKTPARPFAAGLGVCALLTLAGAGLTSLGGCASSDSGSLADITGEELDAGAFTVGWTADLRAENGVSSVTRLGDELIVVDGNNKAFSLTTSGGTLNYVTPVVADDEQMFPPARIETADGPLSVFPSVADAVVLDATGRVVDRRRLDFAFSSPAVETGGPAVVAGISTARGGQFALIDPTAPALPIQDRKLVFGLVTAKPAAYEGVYYLGTGPVQGRGRVYAITQDGNPAWSLDDRLYAETFAGNSADLAADSFGVYVPSDDTQLYVYDRLSGKLKWRYYAGAALTEPASPTRDRVYLPIPSEGLAALDKDGAETVRQPVWTAPGVTTFLGDDGSRVIGLDDAGRVVALDRDSGEVLFTSRRGGFVDGIARSEEGDGPYVVAGDGDVVKVEINDKPGKIGRPL